MCCSRFIKYSLVVVVTVIVTVVVAAEVTVFVVLVVKIYCVQMFLLDSWRGSIKSFLNDEENIAGHNYFTLRAVVIETLVHGHTLIAYCYIIQ